LNSQSNRQWRNLRRYSINFAYTHPNYRVRLHPDVLLAAVRPSMQ
jgi:hypothetical protein